MRITPSESLRTVIHIVLLACQRDVDECHLALEEILLQVQFNT
jgi:hypothetical protein